MPDPASSALPRVSVVVPTHNRAQWLPRAVGSVLAQTWTDFELIVVDDHSTDDTPTVVARLTDHRIRSFRHPRNTGQSGALNTGIARAHGEYVAFLDDDDEWLPGKLAAQVALLDAAPRRVVLAYCWREELDGATRQRLGTTRWTLRGDILEHVLALHVPTSPSSWLVRRSAARSVGGFDEHFHQANDVDFMGRICARGWHVDFVPEVALLKYRHARGQMTDPTPENLAAHAGMVRAHLARFASQLRERPAAHARVHLWLARYELPYGSRRAALAALARAFRLDPVGMCRRFRHGRLAAGMLAGLVRRPSRCRGAGD